MRLNLAQHPVALSAELRALQDIDVDRRESLHSVPAWLGERRAILVSRMMHAVAAALLVGPLACERVRESVADASVEPVGASTENELQNALHGSRILISAGATGMRNSSRPYAWASRATGRSTRHLPSSRRI